MLAKRACRSVDGHFDGMLTVVAKLLHLTRPDLALYGQKDAQQLALIRRMVRDLNFGVDIVGVPTVREEDSLALSSRNRYLSPEERSTALALSQALFAGSDRHAAQEALRARAREVPSTHARAEALSGPTTPEGARVQVHNPPGAEVGPGQIATWGVATADHADAAGFSFDWAGRSSKHFPFDWAGPE